MKPQYLKFSEFKQLHDLLSRYRDTLREELIDDKGVESADYLLKDINDRYHGGWDPDGYQQKGW